ncbi:hypothetical protein [Streptomyces sp. NPDC048623]|uniref:hypothetical protein n=1 Tax=Streptomyces sp. NPDC048623 TaxID=3155761 RepID=UPI003413BE63
MSPLPHDTTSGSGSASAPAPLSVSAPVYASPYRLEDDEGPQTLAELRAALADIDPAELTAFDARLDAARFGTGHRTVITQARQLVAMRTRPEVREAIRASLAGETELMTVEDLFAELDKGGAAS